jgi:hypothetical protein
MSDEIICINAFIANDELKLYQWVVSISKILAECDTNLP